MDYYYPFTAPRIAGSEYKRAMTFADNLRQAAKLSADIGKLDRALDLYKEARCIESQAKARYLNGVIN